MSDKKNNGLLITCIIVIIFALGCDVYVGFQFNKHVKKQQAIIQNLQLSLSKQEERIEELENEIEGNVIEWSENGYNYFAIGNSITKHKAVGYWLDDNRGMASSKDDADYVHLVSNFLREDNRDVVTYAYNFSAWEVSYADRAEFLEMLDIYLSRKIDLITIQLGENAKNLTTWEWDFEELISYVQNKAPNADIIVIGDFWSYGERDSTKQQAAKNCNVMYVSLDGIKDNSNYYAGLGTLVEDANGEMYAIEHEGVASHPGDKGMEAIAKRIIEVLNK